MCASLLAAFVGAVEVEDHALPVVHGPQFSAWVVVVVCWLLLLVGWLLVVVVVCCLLVGGWWLVVGCWLMLVDVSWCLLM